MSRQVVRGLRVERGYGSAWVLPLAVVLGFAVMAVANWLMG